MPLITSCNIACGFHGGDPMHIQKTIQLAIAQNVRILLMPPINKSIISSGVVPGTLQITEGGFPILLMRDAPATGGYLRVLNVVSVCSEINYTFSPILLLANFVENTRHSGAMPVHQLIEQSENIAKRRFFSFVSFRSGLTYS